MPGVSRKQAFFYSVTFVVGLAVVMSVLGSGGVTDGYHVRGCWELLAFRSGGHPHGHGPAVVRHDNLKLGGNAQRFLPQRTGLIGALILGTLFGLVLAPCATPVLAVILTVAAVKGEVAYGSSLLFAYALGQGTLVILAGTFTGVIEGFLQSKGARFGTLMRQAAGGLIFLVGTYVFFQGVRSW